MITGKGLWVWEVEKIGSDVAEMVRLAQRAKIEHVLVKLTDGEYNFPIPSKDTDGSKERLTHDLINSLRGDAQGYVGPLAALVISLVIILLIMIDRATGAEREFDLSKPS